MRIHVVANKNWEVEPLLNAFLTRKVYSNIGLPSEIRWPTSVRQNLESYRALFTTKNGQSIKVSCIQDFITDFAREKSSQYKYEQALPNLFVGDDSELIVCFGTAGYSERIAINGSAMVGHHFFVHNGRTDNPESHLILPEEGKLIGADLVDSKIGQIYDVLRPERLGVQIASLMQLPPNTSCSRPFIAATSTNVAVSVINITNYDDYASADQAGLADLAAVAPHSRPASVETTHGLIACYALEHMGNVSIMWVSAITDREGLFDFEVTPMQNYICAYNGGLALAKAIDSL